MRAERRDPIFQPKMSANRQREEPMSEAKPYDISKRLVWDAWKQVRENQGAAGVDGVSLMTFEKDLKGNLYKIWNRMSSGSYLPPPVRLVEIPKANGGVRPLGIPTIADRVAQTVVKMVLEPEVEPVFHPDSYGYRPGRSALDAVGVARERCWKFDWVIDLDIKSFFDTISHELIERAVAHHTDLGWVRLYVKRWLKAPVERADGTHIERTKGTPQGSVVSPLLANLFLHYAFDLWMQRAFPHLRFERYADDVIVHCGSESQARSVLEAIRQRLAECGLELHSEKTRIVYCQDANRKQRYANVAFDFLGYTFQPRLARNRQGENFASFLPAISAKAAKEIWRTVRAWRMASSRNNQRLEDLARLIDPAVRGWMNYYGRYYRSKCIAVLQHINEALARWARRKYKRLRYRRTASIHWLGRLAQRDPNLLVLWQLGIRPSAGR
jgi:group II intron reverse transcriptase/maturase